MPRMQECAASSRATEIRPNEVATSVRSVGIEGTGAVRAALCKHGSHLLLHGRSDVRDVRDRGSR